MTAFMIRENPGEQTYHIVCQFTVYRERFGHHPSFLPQDEAKGMQIGFATEFGFLVEDDLTKEQALDQLAAYQEQYDTLITELENDDTRWDEFPFQQCPLLWSR